MIVLMILVIGMSVFTTHIIKEGYAAVGAISAFIALVLFISTMAVHFDDVTVGKVEGMIEAGMEPLTNEQIYQMSQKELDECNVVYTFSKTYYFNER